MGCTGSKADSKTTEPMPNLMKSVEEAKSRKMVVNYAADAPPVTVSLGPEEATEYVSIIFLHGLTTRGEQYVEGQLTPEFSDNSFNTKHFFAKVLEGKTDTKIRVVLPTAAKVDKPEVLGQLQAIGLGDGKVPQTSWFRSLKDDAERADTKAKYKDSTLVTVKHEMFGGQSSLDSGFLDWSATEADDPKVGPVAYVHALLRDELKQFDALPASVTSKKLFVGGFSQGGALAIRAAASFPDAKLDGVLLFTSVHCFPDLPGVYHDAQKADGGLRILSTHGSKDQAVPCALTKALLEPDMKALVGSGNFNGGAEEGIYEWHDGIEQTKFHAPYSETIASKVAQFL